MLLGSMEEQGLDDSIEEPIPDNTLNTPRIASDHRCVVYCMYCIHYVHSLFPCLPFATLFHKFTVCVCVCALKMIKYSTEYMKGIANRHSKSEGGQRQYQHQ